MAEGFGSLRHLTGRLVGSLWPGGPARDGEAWARAWLLPGEERLWDAMSGPDRRHSLGVARDVCARLTIADGEAARRPVVAAALLHDVGKIDAGLGTWARVAVTALAAPAGRATVASWAGPGWGLRARAGRYVTHDRIGAGLLRDAGSDPFTVAWAGEHHLPAGRRSVDPVLGAALEAADGD